MWEAPTDHGPSLDVVSSCTTLKLCRSGNVTLGRPTDPSWENSHGFGDPVLTLVDTLRVYVSEGSVPETEVPIISLNIGGKPKTL